MSETILKSIKSDQIFRYGTSVQLKAKNRLFELARFVVCKFERKGPQLLLRNNIIFKFS